MKLIDKLTKNSIYLTFYNKNNKLIGKSAISYKKNIGYINNLVIERDCRLKGYGTKVLSATEEYLIDKFNVNRIELLGWQRQNEFTSNFYFKNKYKLSNSNINLHDDGESIIELIPFVKFFK